MTPLSPAMTNLESANTAALRFANVCDVSWVHVVPSGLENSVPPAPTATNELLAISETPVYAMPKSDEVASGVPAAQFVHA